MRITIACPEAHIADANQLARVLGLGPEDDRTYGAAEWLDAGGNLYSVASAEVSGGFVAKASAPLVMPEWGADMGAATRAQTLLQIIDVTDPAPDGPLAAPDQMVAIVADDAGGALALLGLRAALDGS